MFYAVATIVLSIIIVAEILFDYKKQKFRWKIPLLILIVLGNIGLYLNTKEKERLDQEKWSAVQWREDVRNQNLAEALKKGPEKKKDLFEEASRETAQRFLDFNFSRLQDLFGTERKISEQYLTDYFSEVSKIPNFYTWEEWSETENILFDNMRRSLRGYYSSRNPYSDRGQLVDAGFVKEREKYIKAKKREFDRQ